MITQSHSRRHGGGPLGGALLGIVGALLAIPIAAAVLLLLREVVLPRQQAL